MQLEDYFNFLALTFGSLALIGIETILYEYIYRADSRRNRPNLPFHYIRTSLRHNSLLPA